MQELKEKVEEVINSEPQTKTTSLPPEDVASFYFVKGMEIFRNRIKTLSRKASIRVMTALMQAPFGEEVNLRDQNEKAVFQLGMEIMDNKLMMTVAYIDKHPEQIVQLREHFNKIAKQLAEGAGKNG